MLMISEIEFIEGLNIFVKKLCSKNAYTIHNLNKSYKD